MENLKVGLVSSLIHSRWLKLASCTSLFIVCKPLASAKDGTSGSLS